MGGGGGGTLGTFGWGCATGILDPLAHTRASSAEFRGTLVSDLGFPAKGAMCLSQQFSVVHFIFLGVTFLLGCSLLKRVSPSLNLFNSISVVLISVVFNIAN